MTREDFIKLLIKKQGYNIKSFAAKIDMPYSTLLTMLNGSIGGAAVDSVIKICAFLKIPVELLKNENIPDNELNTHKTSFENYSAHETELIKKYRQLDADGKQRIENQLNFEVEQLKDKESAPSGAQVS